MTREPWTIPPTNLERKIGRLLRSPEEHETETKTEETQTEETKTLVNEEENKTDETKTEETKTEEQKTEETKTEETKVEPLTVEALAAPEGFEIQPEMANKFLEILNGEMEPKDRANALLQLHAETINAASEAGSQAWDDMQKEWKDEAKANPDVGGEKLQPALAGITKLIDEFGDDDLRGVFDLTGAGNNVHMIKFLSKIADKLTEGNFFRASSPSLNDDPNAGAKRMFPSASDAKQ